MKRLLDVNGITKVFGGGTVNEKTALSGVNLIMNEGDFVTVIGNNGAGKSTLLNCIAGVFPVDSWKHCAGRRRHYEAAGAQASTLHRQGLSGPAQGNGVRYDNRAESGNCLLQKPSREVCSRESTKKDRELFREKLSVLGMGLEDRMTEKVKLLSGGQRQSLTLLMAVHCQSEAFASRRTYGGA